MTGGGAPLVYLDTETTGLGPDAQPWEIAAIREHPGGEHVLHLFVEHDTALVASLPERYRADYLARYVRGVAVSRAEAATRLLRFIREGDHLCGVGVAFDAGVVERLLHEHRAAPPWHYHVIDVQQLTIGFLLGCAAMGSPDARRSPPNRPWSSDTLAAVLGVEPPGPRERHTAMGDARWAQRWMHRLDQSGTWTHREETARG